MKPLLTGSTLYHAFSNLWDPALAKHWNSVGILPLISSTSLKQMETFPSFVSQNIGEDVFSSLVDWIDILQVPTSWAMPELFAILAQTTHHMVHFISGARHYVILLTVKSPAAYVDSNRSMKLTWYFLQSADTCWSTVHHCIVERNLRILRMRKTILRLRKFSDCMEHIHVVSGSQWLWSITTRLRGMEPKEKGGY